MVNDIFIDNKKIGTAYNVEISQKEEYNLCDDCIHLSHYKYDREVDIVCDKGHEARLYPSIIGCDDFERESI